MSDAAALFRYRALPEVTRFQQFRPRHLDDTATFIQTTSAKPDIPGTWYQLGAFLEDSRELIGDFGIHFCNTPGEIELGCTIAPAYWSQGYATEALSSIISYLFIRMRKQKITALVDPANTRSRTLFRKLGFLLAHSDGWEVYQLDNTRWNQYQCTDGKSCMGKS